MAKHQSVIEKWQNAINEDPDRATSILSELKGNQFYITFNRPKRFNAFTNAMYDIFQNLLVYANQNPQVKFIIVSGSEGNFSSGNDLANFANERYTCLGDVRQLSTAASVGLQKLCDAIIDSEKPIFALVEGKVIGFAFTQLALYDKVFAVETAQFNAPLVQLAQGPEMCASFTFPKIFGRQVGEDLIVKGTKVSADFLAKYNFCQKFKTRQIAQQALQQHLQELNELEWASYLTTRKLFRQREAKILRDTNARQCKNLIERWVNPQLPNHLFEYMKKVKARSKL